MAASIDPSYSEWRLIRSGSMTGARNMACDTALLNGVIDALEHGERPTVTLRLYYWEPPAISLGYHQSENDLDLERLRADGVSVVRRPTGGRAIYHARELTYAVAGPLALFPGEQSVLGAYKVISRAILTGLRLRLGIDAALARGTPATEPTGKSPVACFARPALCDAVSRGKKIVGSAQVRRRRAFLQHGSIPLVPREAEEREVLLGAGAPVIDTLGSLSEAAGREVARDEAADALVAGFERELGVRFRGSQLCAGEREVMDSLIANVLVL